MRLSSIPSRVASTISAMTSSSKTWHPDQQQLVAFAYGRLSPAERTSIQVHFDQCEACCQEFIKLQGSSDSMLGQDTQATAGIHPVPLPVPFIMPADLANHPRYEILQLIGKGGMGAVYKARHKRMDRLVALKVINAMLVGNEKAVERFQREAKAAAKLHHPHIVTAFDSDLAGNTHFLVMEFVDGTDLAKHVDKKGPLPVAYACHFIRQAALGLQHAHEAGMVHRDIKPHNLMLTRSPFFPATSLGRKGSHVKITDFGLSRLTREGASEAGLTSENVLMGTADYLAPEQAKDAHNADIRADIYSLGCTLFHLLVGKPPFGGGMAVQKIACHLVQEIPLVDLPSAVPQELGAVLAKMVDKDPAKRYQTPTDVYHALTPFVMKPTEEQAYERLLQKEKGDGEDNRGTPSYTLPISSGRLQQRRKRGLGFSLLIGGWLVSIPILIFIVIWSLPPDILEIDPYTNKLLEDKWKSNIAQRLEALRQKSVYHRLSRGEQDEVRKFSDPNVKQAPSFWEILRGTGQSKSTQ